MRDRGDRRRQGREIKERKGKKSVRSRREKAKRARDQGEKRQKEREIKERKGKKSERSRRDKFHNMTDNSINEDESFNQDLDNFISDSVAKAIKNSMGKITKNLQSSIQDMVSKSLLAHSAGECRKRKIKDLSSQKTDGASLTDETSSPQIEDKSHPRPPSKEGNPKLKCSEKIKHISATPQKITISHISDTDDDMGDLDDPDDDPDIWGSQSQSFPPPQENII
ncbi:protein FAM133-like [Pleurodeles waltl]|uniref:protein FAM133-like n=1 Tax=Pleurodeles waltl TaxID=8319 RepID=UPI0037099B30